MPKLEIKLMTHELASTVQNSDGQAYFLGSLFTEIGLTRFYVSEELLRALVYKGKSKTPVENLSFDSLEQLQQWSKEQIDLAQKKLDHKLNNTAYTHRMHVGSVITARMDNVVKFFQVVKAETPKTIYVREIESVTDDECSSYAPLVGKFKSEIQRKNVLSSTSVKIQSEIEGHLMTDFRVLELTGSKIYMPVKAIIG